LAKFFGLVANEYIKILKKASTKVMIVLVILAAFGLCGVLKIAKTVSEKYAYESETTAIDYSDDIEWLKSTTPDGWEEEIAYYEYIQDFGLTYDDSRYSIIDKVHEMGLPFETEKNLLDGYLNGSDWKTLCTQLEQLADSDAQKWEYEYRIEQGIEFGDTWKDDLISQIVDAKETLSYVTEGKEAAEAEKTVTLDLYRIENNIEYNAADSTDLMNGFGDAEDSNFWLAMFGSSQLISLIGLLIMIIAGGCVANEFSQGTIKFLLINPIKRWKILMAKYFTVITFGYIMLAVMFVATIPAAALLLGTKQIGAAYLTVKSGTVVAVSPFVHAIKLYLLGSVSIVAMATFAMAVSSLAKNAALAIGISVFLLMAGNTIVSVLSQLGQDWARYILFANTDLQTIANGQSTFPSQTLSFALTVIAAHMAVFILTMWDGFTKREI
jgi:ABC-2 type transport system permease protein